jgi:hypothetical protein
MKTSARQIHSGGRRAREKGIALVIAVFTIAALLVAITGALVTSSANSKAAWNYKGASQAHFVAESGISHAMQTMNSIGVVNYQNEIANNWSTMWGNGSKTFSELSAPNNTTYKYTVTNTAGAVPASSGRLVAVATQSDAAGNIYATNAVVANIVRDNNPSTAPGAIYLASDGNTNAGFNGNSFAIDGNDHTLSGGTGSGISIPGISTRNATNTNEAVASLNAVQKDNVQGYGYVSSSPPVPSISTSPSAPTIAQIQQMITDITTNPGCAAGGPCSTCGCSQINNSCSCDFGDPYATPSPVCKVVTVNSGLQVKNNGNVDGCGVMIVNGNFDIQGNVSFRGLIIVKGTLTVTGSALVYGSVWTEGLAMDVGGNGQVYYSSQAMQLANNVFPTGAIPAPMKISSLADCADLGSGVGGCP